jgi:diguanylate cyclase with GGDEF domain/PucR-like helix-turn-helix protein
VPDALPAEVLAEVAAGGAADAGGVRAELLGDFLSVVGAAVEAGTPISARQLRSYRTLGAEAAREGVALRALLDLYLSAAWRLWRHLPPVADAARDPAAVVVAGEVMLHAVDDVVASLAEGFQLAQRDLVRAQESARREFVDDLLTGSTDVIGLLRRATGVGIDLSGPHAVATVRANRPFDDSMPVIRTMERAVHGSKGDAHALLASKEGRLVVVFAAPDRAAVSHVVDRITKSLGRRRTTAWQVGVGRAAVGADGVVSSYRESLDGLALAERLGLDAAVIDARDLLVYQVLLRDRAALLDLVEDTLAPLRAARGGADPLVVTLRAYFDAGANAARCARALHLSVRAVTYRLARVRALTGLDPNRADDRFSLHVAVLGAQLLDW